MKTLLSVLLIILISIQSFSQINPDEFPKIGYADMYWLKGGAYYNNSQINYSDSSWFYPALSELGLTHVVSDHPHTTPALINQPPYNSNYNTNIKIIDAFIGKASNHSYNRPYKYAHSTGNSLEFLSYEAGGDNIALITNNSTTDNCGFGGVNKSSWWIYPYNNECIGNLNFNDPENPGTIVHYAQAGVHNPGILLKAKPDAFLFPYDSKWGHVSNYRLSIRARIDGTTGSENVAKVRIWEVMPGTTPAFIGDHYKTFNFIEEEDQPETLTDYTYYITANAFGGNQYIELTSPNTFRKTQSLSSQGGASDLYITIEWLGTRNLYIDRIAIYNTFYDDLFIANSQVVRNNIKNDLESLYGTIKTHFLFTHPYNDEPFPILYRGVKEVSNLAEQQLGIGKYVNGATLSLSNDMSMMANIQRRLPYVLYDLYPITENISTSSSGTNSIQNAFDNLIYNSWGSPGYGVERYNGLRAGIDLAQNFTPDEPIDDIPFYHTLQVQAEKNVFSGQWVEPFRFRAPTPNEILAQGNLALCYGAKGLMYFLVCTLTPEETNNIDTIVAFYGLFEEDGHFGEIIQNPAAPQKRNERYCAVKHLHDDIAPIEQELLSLTWKDAYSIHLEQPSGKYISSVNYYPPINCDIEYGSPCEFIELGLFKNTDQINNDNLEYFFLVNRRTLPSETRTIKTAINKSPSNYINWGISERGTSNTWTIGSTGNFQASFDPGEGKLFRLAPVIHYGGKLDNNETISSPETLHDVMTIDNGATLTINSAYNCEADIIIKNGSIVTTNGGTINFNNGSKLIIEDSAVINGTSSDKLTLDFISSGNGNGIVIEPGGSLNISYCKVQNAENGINAELNTDDLFVSYVDFSGCSNSSITVLGYSGEGESIPPPPDIRYCTMQNSLYGISISNLSQVIIRENQIINTGFGIYLSNISTPAIIGNAITGGTPQFPGIFLESCNGVVRGNVISGHTNGIHLGNSSPDIGGNILENNWNRGLYVGEGSLPNLEGRLVQDPNHPNLYYAVSGYNKIRNNGGWFIDDDGSEIFLYNSGILMKGGCNEVTDQRIPDVESTPPLYNTRLLINWDGNDEVIEIDAQENFWDEHPLYHLEERFGENLIVYYEPVLTEPCPQPDGGGEKLFVKSSSGETVDTLYAEETTPALTQTEQLYASAEGKFLTADFNGADTIYNQIINGDDSIQVKLDAYKRIYEIGKLTNKPETYFDNLYSTFTSISQSTDNEFMKKIFSHLGSLSLIGKQEYIPAINEFDNVVQQNPNTEGAFYAEIDILTTSLLADTGNTQLGKFSNGKYLVKGSSDYMNKLNTLMKKHFGVEGEDKKEKIIPTEYSLFQNYPNPFNPVTVIRYDIPKAGNVELKVYDILGREVMTLVKNEKKEAGRYEVQFNAAKLSTGVYIYRIQTNDPANGTGYVAAKKMILVK